LTAFFLFLFQADVFPVHATAIDIGDIMLRVTSHIEISESEFDFSFARSGGPGGQNVNKVSSKAVLRWDITRSQALPPGVRQRFLEKYHNRVTRDGILVLQSQRYRDQGRNVADCIERLRQMILQVATPPVKRRPTKPTRGSQRRRIQNKKQNSDKKKMRRRPNDGD
jgi:ribosome-associated protein